jgi:N-acyl-D-aspartate/D-glutamate deacylase
LRDPATRERLKRHKSVVSNFEVVGWDKVFLFTSWARPELVGKSFQELTPGGGHPLDVALDVLLAEADAPHRSLVICHAYEEEWLRQTFQHPLCTLGSDATALCTDGPLAETLFLGAYTWAAWFFRRFVRETGDFTVEEAVRKLTAMPAERIGLDDRGRLKTGARADIVVFDADRFREMGTLEDPNRLAEGVAHVVVNGGVAMENGEFTGDRTGRALRR